MTRLDVAITAVFAAATLEVAVEVAELVAPGLLVPVVAWTVAAVAAVARYVRRDR
jgi:hypothetical protein